MKTNVHPVVCVAWLLAALGGPAAAYEFALQNGYGETRLGDPIHQTGTRRTETSPPIDVRINLLRVDDTDLNGTADSSSLLPAPDSTRLSTLVDAACRYWEQVPSSSIALRLAGTDQTSTYRGLRSSILVTLGTIRAPYQGMSWGAVSIGQFLPYGIILSIESFRANPDAAVLAEIVHELGHQLAIKHSSCDRQLTSNSTFGFVDSEGAFMSAGDKDGRTVLHSDDVAAVSQGYPVAASATQFGSISGELVDTAGAPIFGGNVFAVDSRNRAISSRLSGLHQFTSTSARHGRFLITGLPPGTYTLVAASVTDPTYRIGLRTDYPFDTYFVTDFAPAMRRNVSVVGGQTFSVGQVQAGSTANGDGSPITTPAGPVPVEYRWTPLESASFYYAYVYSYASSQWIVNAQKTTTPSITLALADGQYRLFVYAWAASMYVPAEDRTLNVPSTGTNGAPQIMTYPNVSAMEPDQVVIPFNATDPEGGPVTVQATGLPAGMTKYTNWLQWDVSAAGSWTIRLTATDSTGLTATRDVLLTVTANQPPTLIAPSTVAAVEPTAVSIPISAIDPEGGAVTVAATGMPSGMTVSSTRLYWPTSAAGSWTIAVTATDPSGKKSTKSIALTVTKPAPTKARVTFKWPSSSTAKYYYLQVYSYSTGTWFLRQYVTGGTYTIDLDPGKYQAVIQKYTTAWSTIGTKTFDAAGTMTVQIP